MREFFVSKTEEETIEVEITETEIIVDVTTDVMIVSLEKIKKKINSFL